MLDMTYNGAIDAVASATENKVFLHVANTDMSGAQELLLDLGGKTITSGKMYYIAERPEIEITPVNMDVFAAKEVSISSNRITLPAAAVAAIELTIAD